MSPIPIEADSVERATVPMAVAAVIEVDSDGAERADIASPVVVTIRTEEP